MAKVFGDKDLSFFDILAFFTMYSEPHQLIDIKFNHRKVFSEFDAELYCVIADNDIPSAEEILSHFKDHCLDFQMFSLCCALTKYSIADLEKVKIADVIPKRFSCKGLSPPQWLQNIIDELIVYLENKGKSADDFLFVPDYRYKEIVHDITHELMRNRCGISIDTYKTKAQYCYGCDAYMCRYSMLYAARILDHLSNNLIKPKNFYMLVVRKKDQLYGFAVKNKWYAISTLHAQSIRENPKKYKELLDNYKLICQD